MTALKRDEVVIPLATLEKITEVLRRGEVKPGSDEARLLVDLTDRVVVKKLELEESKIIHMWDIVEPKEGKNNLRAGATAYGRAIALYAEPFVLVSEDGKFKWEGLHAKDFTVVGKLPMDMIVEMNARWGKYPIIG